MSIDLSQFHEVFFEESFEGLDTMENGLLALSPGSEDDESINEIFRAAHSIKGGAGTFGFSVVSDFTHDLETLLDEMREGIRAVSQDLVDLMLRAVDCLREMLESFRAKNEPDLDVSKRLTAEFEKVLGQEPSVEAVPSVDAPPLDDSIHRWHVYFKPDNDVLRTGNEPYRMFRELQGSDGVKDFKVEAVLGSVPVFGEWHPEECYLAWDIYIKGNVSKEEIECVFEWVIDDAELKINDLSTAQGQSQSPNLGDDFTPAEPPVVDASADVVVLTPPVEEPSKPIDVVNAASPEPKKEKASKESASIRVGIDKVDELINMVGELVITQSMLGQLGKEFTMDRLDDLVTGLSQLEHNTRELQESVMKIRMLPISFAFSRFPRLVRDIGQQLDKKVQLLLLGEQTELDKTVMEKIGDPLTHLVRNSLDHGLEPPAERLAAGKPEVGQLTLNAFHQGGNIVIEVKDDGRGLNTDKIYEKAKEKGLVGPDEVLTAERINDLIFMAGFSTADAVSDLSGRGVGMDVVRRNIQSLNGSVEVESFAGKGSVFTIRLPLTLAILDGQLVRIGEETYIFPLVSIVESIQVNENNINYVAGQCEVYRLRAENIPILKLYELFDTEVESKVLHNSLMVVVESGGAKVGIIVDELLDQQQVVIKSLETNYEKVEGVSGATILGNGTVALIADVNGIIQMASRKYERAIEHLHATDQAGSKAA
ncbi:MAG: chemotaxis protein CheA [Gammaproteobacteria bacterium]|nr:MAG: chemotaxis protein CheA [Gammaproteobacteria bacterium]